MSPDRLPPAWRRAAGPFYRLLPARVAANLRQWLNGAAHERDFEILDRLRDVPGTMLDVGANRGHAALSALSRTRRLRVFSLEPNPALAVALATVRLLYPRRFRYRLAGAGVCAEERSLYQPTAAGVDLSPQASLDASQFARPLVRARLAAVGLKPGDDQLVERRVQLVAIDGLGLSPDLVKIDVEGWEAAVLGGAQATLAAHRPALLIELNDPAGWWPALAEQGYRPYRLTADGDCLEPAVDFAGLLNLWALHPDQDSPLGCALRALVRSAPA